MRHLSNKNLGVWNLKLPISVEIKLLSFKALEYLNHVLHQARCIRRINLNVQVSTTGLVESLLAPLIGHGNSFILNTITKI